MAQIYSCAFAYARGIYVHAFDKNYAQAYSNMMNNVLDMLRAILDKDISGLTQNELAERLNVTQPTVSRWLAGSDPRGAHRDAIRSLYHEVTGSPATIRSHETPLSKQAAATLARLRGDYLARAEQIIIVLGQMQDLNVPVPDSPDIRHNPESDNLPPPPQLPSRSGKSSGN